jgi:hypothetical protein
MALEAMMDMAFETRTRTETPAIAGTGRLAEAWKNKSESTKQAQAARSKKVTMALKQGHQLSVSSAWSKDRILLSAINHSHRGSGPCCCFLTVVGKDNPTISVVHHLSNYASKHTNFGDVGPMEGRVIGFIGDISNDVDNHHHRDELPLLVKAPAQDPSQALFGTWESNHIPSMKDIELFYEDQHDSSALVPPSWKSPGSSNSSGKIENSEAVHQDTLNTGSQKQRHICVASASATPTVLPNMAYIPNEWAPYFLTGANSESLSPIVALKIAETLIAGELLEDKDKMVASDSLLPWLRAACMACSDNPEDACTSSTSIAWEPILSRPRELQAWARETLQMTLKREELPRHDSSHSNSNHDRGQEPKQENLTANTKFFLVPPELEDAGTQQKSTGMSEDSSTKDTQKEPAQQALSHAPEKIMVAGEAPKKHMQDTNIPGTKVDAITQAANTGSSQVRWSHRPASCLATASAHGDTSINSPLLSSRRIKSISAKQFSTFLKRSSIIADSPSSGAESTPPTSTKRLRSTDYFPPIDEEGDDLPCKEQYGLDHTSVEQFRAILRGEKANAYHACSLFHSFAASTLISCTTFMFLCLLSRGACCLASAAFQRLGAASGCEIHVRRKSPKTIVVRAKTWAQAQAGLDDVKQCCRHIFQEGYDLQRH